MQIECTLKFLEKKSFTTFYSFILYTCILISFWKSRQTDFWPENPVFSSLCDETLEPCEKRLERFSMRRRNNEIPFSFPYLQPLSRKKIRVYASIRLSRLFRLSAQPVNLSIVGQKLNWTLWQKIGKERERERERETQIRKFPNTDYDFVSKLESFGTPQSKNFHFIRILLTLLDIVRRWKQEIRIKLLFNIIYI